MFVFQWFITFSTRLIAYIVPDMPKDLDLKIKREEYLAKQRERGHKEADGRRKSRSRTGDGGSFLRPKTDLTHTETQML